MAERPTEPERTMVFGDGCFATLVDLYEDEETNEMVFMFRPTPRMKQRKDIQEEDYDEVEGWIIGRYPKDLCVCLDPSPDFQVWLLFCDYYARPCDLTKKINQELLNKSRIYRNEANVLNNLMKVRFNKLIKIVKHPEEFKSELITEMIKQKKAISTSIEDYSKGDLNEK